MFMVIAYHATLYLQSADVDAVLGRAKAAFELFPMPVFFLIAGMFATRHAQYSFRGLWTRRLLPLLYLYVVWSAIRAAFYAVVPGLNGELGELPATDPLTLLLILVWPSSSYWFLYALLIFTLFRWLIAGAPVWLQVSGSAVVSTLFTAGVVDAGNIGWNRVGALFFFFVLGAVFARQIRDVVPRARLIHLGLATVAFGAVAGLIVLGLRWVPLVVLVGQLAAVAVGILTCARLARLRVFAIFATLGVRSLKVYLLHLFVIVPAVALIALADPDWPRWVDVLVQAVLIALAVAASLGLARVTTRLRWLYLPPAALRNPRDGADLRGRRRPDGIRAGSKDDPDRGDRAAPVPGP
jgi:fucose 4-O-acetylase-like acetyltransferase